MSSGALGGVGDFCGCGWLLMAGEGADADGVAADVEASRRKQTKAKSIFINNYYVKLNKIKHFSILMVCNTKI